MSWSQSHNKCAVLAALVAAVSTSLAVPAATHRDRAQAATASRPLIGAIRWDGWFPNDKYVDPLVFSNYDYREPTYGWYDDQSTPNHQAIVDQEIQTAADHHLDFWAFDWYPDVTYDTANQFRGPYIDYKNSQYKGRLKFADLVQTHWLGGPVKSQYESTWVPALVGDFEDSQYVKIGNRPVLYWFATDELADPTKGWGSVAAAQAEIQYLRDQTTAVGLGAPFIIQVSGNPSDISTYGLDGQGEYRGPFTASHQCWSAQYKADFGNVNAQASNSQPVAPTLNPLNDARPRGDDPSYVLGPPPDGYADQPTFGQWLNELHDMYHWTQANSGHVTDPPLILTYAWNELDEGGPGIAPTVQEGTKYLDAINDVFVAGDPGSFDDKIGADNCAVTYQGSGWTRSFPVHGDYNNGEQQTSTAGDSASVSWDSTTGFDVIATTDSDRGAAQILIDGQSQGTVSLYSPSAQHQQLVYSINNLPRGPHTLTIVDSSGKIDITAITIHAPQLYTSASYVDDNDTSRIQYGSGWTSSPGRGYGDYNDDVHYATADNSSLTFTFTGTSVGVIGEKYSDEGNLNASIDGQPATLISEYNNGTRAARQLVYLKTGLSNTTHTLTLTKAGGGPYVTVDAFTTANPVNDTSGSDLGGGGILYTGAWTYSPQRGFGDYNDDEHYTQTNGDSASYTFYGTGVAFLTERNAENSTYDIQIDGGPAASVNTYSAVRLGQQLVWQNAAPLTTGIHTITVTKWGGNYGDVDGFYVLP